MTSDNSNDDLTDRVLLALEELLPAMIADGGGAELVSLEDGVATIRLLGSCNFCPSRRLSAEALQRGLLARAPELTEIRILYPAFQASSGTTLL